MHQNNNSSVTLLPLRLYAGWVVITNNLYEVEPVVHGGMLQNEQFFPSLLLHIKETGFLYADRKTQPYRYGDQIEFTIHFEIKNKKPTYILRLHECTDTAEKYLAEFEHQQLNEIMKKFDLWFRFMQSIWRVKNIPHLATITLEQLDEREKNSEIRKSYETFTDVPPTIMSFRIPSGWAMVTNNLFELDPLVINGEFKNAIYFSQDLLSINRLQDNKFGDIYIGADWIPDGQIDGQYRLAVSWGRSLDDQYNVNCPSWQELQTKVNEWLQILSENDDVFVGLKKIKNGR